MKTGSTGSLGEEPQDSWGLIYALLAFGWWGFVFPSLLISLNTLAAPLIASRIGWSLEILANRVVWCLLVCCLMLHASGRWRPFLAVLRDRRIFLGLLLSSALIAANWFGFIVGASIGKLSQASLGYYINPLLNVLLGYVFLGERLRRGQMVAVGLAAVGVAWLTWVHGETPWIAFLVAGSFAVYGLVRKQLAVDSLVGMTWEALFCLPAAAAYLAYRQIEGPALVMAAGAPLVNGLLLAAGPATAAPLIWFSAAAKRLRLATVGFLQFVAPTGQLLMAVAANGEAFSWEKLCGFVLIWAGVVAYLWDLRRK